MKFSSQLGIVLYMCDICKTENLNYAKNTEERYPFVKASLHKVFVNSRALVTLCRVHDIELFRFGEGRFLRKYQNFSHHIASNSLKFKRS